MNNYWHHLITKNSDPAPAIQPRLPARFEWLAAAEPPGEDAAALPPRPARPPKPSAPEHREETINPATPTSNAAPAPAPPPDAAPAPAPPPDAAPPRRSIRLNTITAAPLPPRPVAPAPAQADDESGRSELPVLPPAPGTESPAPKLPQPQPQPPRQNNRPAPQPVQPANSSPPAARDSFPPGEPESRLTLATASPQPAAAAPPTATRAAAAPPESSAPPTAPARIEPNLAPAPRLRPAETAPAINVRIGRIEVKAAPSQPPATPQPARPRFRPGLSLDDYLQQRSGEKR